MNGTELGSMYVENEVIRIIETSPKDTADERAMFLRALNDGNPPLYSLGELIRSEWWATSGDRPLGYAVLSSADADYENVHFFVAVVPERRGIGIGTLMIRFARDQAIKNRIRSVEVIVTPEAANILENEGFELKEANTYRLVLDWK